MKTYFYYFCEFFLLPILKFIFVDEIFGKENIPQKGGFIIASNHISTLDHFLIGIAFQEKLKKIHFLGKREGWSGILRIPLDYLAETIVFSPKNLKRDFILEKLTEYLKSDKIVIIYPEGDTNKEKELKKGKTGVAELLLKSKVPVIPVGIYKLEKTSKWRIKIGHPISFEQFKNTNDLEMITNTIMKEISKLCKKSYPYGD
jgi:1-acyl-sn-glycerol-3-phosphate acyltransferase